MPNRWDQPVDVELTVRDVMMLGAGLRSYLLSWQQHVDEDGGAAHPEDENAEVHRQVGELIWRLECAGAPPGARIEHSAEAVEPSGPYGQPNAGGAPT